MVFGRNIARTTGRWILLTAFFAVAKTAASADNVAGNLILFNDDGGWSWYMDERTIIDLTNNSLLVSSNATFNAARNGNTDVVTYGLNSGNRSRFTLADINPDDHNAAALLVRPDGRYLAMYANHNTDLPSRYRVSVNPHDAGSWTPEQQFNWGTVPGSDFNVTYSNLFYLSAENKTYNIARATHRSPNIMLSSNQGNTWTWGGQITTGTSQGYVNGYFKYASNNVDRIWFIGTEQHPRDFNTSVYAGYIQGGKSYNSTGGLLDNDISDNVNVPFTNQFTPVRITDPENGTQQRTRFWTTDLELGADGNPYALFTSRANDNPVNTTGYNDHRLFYSRFSGTQWQTFEVARLGARLFDAEQDYTGLGALVPGDPNTIYISTAIDPRNTATTPKHEIYKGVTSNGGASWTWTPITQNSTVDNLRPIVPAWDANHTAVLWNRGTMTTSQIYDQSVVGIIDRKDQQVGLVRYVDATPANTARSNGAAIGHTGPNIGEGGADNNWNLRTGVGNGPGNDVFASGGSGAENSPALKTTITGLAAGTYDVFAYFWANPANDWRIQVGLDLNNLLLVRDNGAQQAELVQFDAASGAIALTGGGASLYRAYVGRVSAVAGSSIDVYIDDFSATAATRTWYDGVGYAEVTAVPEPATFILFTMAGIPFVVRRGKTMAAVAAPVVVR